MDATTPPLGESFMRDPIATSRSKRAVTRLPTPVAVAQAAMILQIDQA